VHALHAVAGAPAAGPHPAQHVRKRSLHQLLHVRLSARMHALLRVRPCAHMHERSRRLPVRAWGAPQPPFPDLLLPLCIQLQGAGTSSLCSQPGVWLQVLVKGTGYHRGYRWWCGSAERRGYKCL
jgi:hypothetical protein